MAIRSLLAYRRIWWLAEMIEADPETMKKDVVWFALGDDRPLEASVSIWTELKRRPRDQVQTSPGPRLVLLSQKDAFCELGIIDRFGRFGFRHEELRWITQ